MAEDETTGGEGTDGAEVNTGDVEGDVNVGTGDPGDENDGTDDGADGTTGEE